MAAYSILIYFLFLQIFDSLYQMHLWSPWSGCSSACGPGVHIRYRGCRIGFQEIPVCPYHGHEEWPCNGYYCPSRPGTWSPWSSSPCSKSCGGGMTTKYRTCTSPTPVFGGQGCRGKSVEIVSCNTHSCAVNGAWSSWQSPSHCTVSCGGGVRIRTRTCNNPKPSNGGHTCQGIAVHSATCNTQSCSASISTIATRKTPKPTAVPNPTTTTNPKTTINYSTANPTTAYATIKKPSTANLTAVTKPTTTTETSLCNNQSFQVKLGIKRFKMFIIFEFLF